MTSSTRSRRKATESRDDLEVLLQRDAQVVAHVEVPRLADDGDDGRLGAQQRIEVAVVGSRHAGAPRGAEGGDAGVPETESAHRAEELLVARIRARPAALDVVDAEGVETLGDAQLVVEREADVLRLAPSRSVVS